MAAHQPPVPADGTPPPAGRNAFTLGGAGLPGGCATVRALGSIRHTALLDPSGCAGAYESRYLLAGALPRPGTACAQNTPPFTPPAPRAGAGPRS